MDFQLEPVYPKRVWRNFQGHKMDSKLGPLLRPLLRFTRCSPEHGRMFMLRLASVCLGPRDSGFSGLAVRAVDLPFTRHGPSGLLECRSGVLWAADRPALGPGQPGSAGDHVWAAWG